MEQHSRGIRVQIYCGETDRAGHRPRYQAILDFLREEGAAGATVTRGIAGFGRNSLIHTAAILRLSMDLPVVITWIDAPERVERLLPEIRRISGSGVITVDEVGIASYGERAVGQMRFDLQIRDVMTRDVKSVRADASVRVAVEALVARPFRALPVVDESGRPVGIVSNADLLLRGGLEARVQLLTAMAAGEREKYLARLPDRLVSSIMSPNPVTIAATATLAEAARLLRERRLKRLPVVDGDGALVGIISRADVLRAVAEAFPGRESVPATATQPRTAGDIMRADVPVVPADAGLPEVVDAVCSTRLNRAVVVDGENRPIGIVSDAAVLEALGSAGGGVVGALMHVVRLTDAPAAAARDLMAVPAQAVMADAPLSDVARIMTEQRRKIVPVTDAAGRLIGIIDRSDLLAATTSALSDAAAASSSDEDD